MKLKIYIKCFAGANLPKVIDKGDWVDLAAWGTYHLSAPQAGVRVRETKDGVTYSHRDVTFQNQKIGLGVAMKLPAGCEAVAVPRSGLYDAKGIILANSMGVIDQTYCGDNDMWKFNAIAFRDTVIEDGERICQFRIQLSQKATFWQRLKWTLCNGIEIVQVDSLSNVNRGGFGTTGLK